MKFTTLIHASAAAVGLLADPAIARVVHRYPRSITIRTNVASNATAGNTLIPVVVGGPQDLFVPNLVRANVGDVVQFQFSNGNHTVTQSAEAKGCEPLQATDPNAIHSGHIPYEEGQVDVGTFSMVVQSTEPMFLYCATGPHCQTGQVMVINPTNDIQLANYAKVSQTTTESVDGSHVAGGIVGKITLEKAAFVPAPPEEEEAPPAEEPPAEEPPAEEPPAEEPPADAPPADAPPAEAPPAEGEAPPAEGEMPPKEEETPAKKEEAPAEEEA